jgi:hypothetical protein
VRAWWDMHIVGHGGHKLTTVPVLAIGSNPVGSIEALRFPRICPTESPHSVDACVMRIETNSAELGQCRKNTEAVNIVNAYSNPSIILDTYTRVEQDHLV